MAYDLKESWDASSTTENKDGNGNLSAGAVRVFTVLCDTISEANDESQVRAQLPNIGEPHPRLGVGFILSNINLTRSSPLMWEASLNYDTTVQQVGAGGEATFELVPWAYPTNVSFGTSQVAGETNFDASGDPIKNSAEQPFSATRQYADLIITLERAFIDFNPAEFWNYINKVNSDEFLGFPAYSLKVNSIAAKPNLFQGARYYDVTVAMAARKAIENGPLTQSQVWDFGFYQKGTVHYVYDGGLNGFAVANDNGEERYLNGDGELLPVGSPPVLAPSSYTTPLTLAAWDSFNK